MDSIIEMAEIHKEVEMLKIVIEDERHYRSMVQSRISYHTSIILALIALTGVLAVRSDSLVNFILISPFGLLISYISKQAVVSVKRLYQHFIEAIRAREEIESVLGIRNALGDRKEIDEVANELQPLESEDPNKYWKYSEIFLGSWVPSKGVCGYFCRTEKVFKTFGRIGDLIFFIMLLMAWVMANQCKYI